jgi:hypothetical protein
MNDGQPLHCIECGSQNLEPGRIAGTRHLYFAKNDAFWGWQAMAAVACLDCGHVTLRLKNVVESRLETDPVRLIEEYRAVASQVVTATNQRDIDEYRRILEELRGKWQGEESLHEIAFGDHPS